MGVPGQWAEQRQPGSFRGVPFVVLENSLKRGRQIGLHVYPFRDDPWPEDLGRSPRITSFTGFVLGDDCDQQIAALCKAVETAGPGPLVHPAMGTITAVVLEFSCSDRAERGRMWSFEMSIVPWLIRIYPIIANDTQAQTKGLFGATGAALAQDFMAVRDTVQAVQAQVTSVVQTVQGYAAQAQSLVHDATSLVNLPASLIGGNFGRFAGGGLASGAIPGFTSIALASSAVSGAFNRVSNISNTLSGLASKL